MEQEQHNLLIEELKEHIKSIIRETVNGKIDRIDQKIDNYIKEDYKWKEEAKPVIEMGKNVQGFGKVSLYLIGFVASVIGAILAIIKLTRNE